MDAPLDPAVAQALKTLPSLDAAGGEADKLRAALRSIYESRKHGAPRAVASVTEESVAGAHGALRVRVYRPSPTIVYFHGGGWVAGDLDTHDRVARGIALDTSAVLVSVDYRQPPETRFPGAFDDALAATREVIARIDEYGGDKQAVGVAGDSAGANLAAATAIALRDDGVALAGQLLIYPVVDVAGLYSDVKIDSHYPSRVENRENYFLTLRSMQHFSQLYLADPASASDWRASPLRAPTLRGVAPTVLSVAHFDPLRDEGLAYADLLSAAGVDIKIHRGPGLIHGYFGMAAAVPAAQTEVKRVCGDF